MNSQAQAVDEVLDWFEDEAHWTRGQMRRVSEDGIVSTCLLGGINLVMGSPRHLNAAETAEKRRAYSGLLESIREVIEEQFPDRCREGRPFLVSTVKFNDHKETTLEDVRGVLEKVRARLQEAADAS